MLSLGVDDETELKNRVRDVLERQVKYEQRQAAREQVLAQITASADWELPESLVLRQVENALRREYLEMREAGYTEREVEARLSRMRQNQLSETREALKQHFILDKLATREAVVVEPADKEYEIRNMAQQAGESVRKVRARLEKEGLMENLEAQIRERKAVDLVLAKAVFEDVPGKTSVDEAFPVDLAVCGQAPGAEPAAAPDVAAE
jgi:trigger factor